MTIDLIKSRQSARARIAMAGEGAVRWRYLGGRENGCPHTKEFKLKPRALDNAAKAFDFLHAKRVRVEKLWLCAVQ